MLWRACAAVARGRGTVSDARVDVEEHSFSTFGGSRDADRFQRPRSYRVTVTMYVDTLDYTTADAVRLSRLTQLNVPEEPTPTRARDETLEAVRVAATGPVVSPAHHPHDIHCRQDRARPQTPGMNGCSCRPVPDAVPQETSPVKPRETQDDAMTRFSLLELK